MSETDKRGDRDRKFRRPPIEKVVEENDAPATGESGLPAVPPSAEEMAVVMKPLKDLADAFQANTETLRSLAEGQARIGRRLERTDRSEAVINSTQALNETFRGVRRTQEQLIGRLSREGKRPWLYLLTGFALASLLVGGGFWLLLDWLEGKDASESRSGAEVFARAMAEKDRASEEIGEEARALTADLVEARTRAAGLETQVTELRERIDALETQNGNLRESQMEMDDLRAARAALTTKAERLSDELTAARRELAAAREELALAREDLARRKEEPVRPEASAQPEKEPASIPEGAVTNPVELDRVRSVLNGLLAETAGGAYRIEKIGGIRGKMLYDVVIVDGRSGEADAKRFEAKEARIAIDESRRRVEIRLKTGFITYYGVRARFWDDRYVLPLTDIPTEKWTRSGLTIFERG